MSRDSFLGQLNIGVKLTDPSSNRCGLLIQALEVARALLVETRKGLETGLLGPQLTYRAHHELIAIKPVKVGRPAGPNAGDNGVLTTSFRHRVRDDRVDVTTERRQEQLP